MLNPSFPDFWLLTIRDRSKIMLRSSDDWWRMTVTDPESLAIMREQGATESRNGVYPWLNQDRSLQGTLAPQLLIQLLIAVLSLISGGAMAIEEPDYTVVATYETFEVRDYKPYILAEVTVKGELDAVSNEGFRLLAGYIFGKNHRPNLPKNVATKEKISMTAPVVVSEVSGPEKIAMTAPVNVTQAGAETYRIQFTMPREYTLETLPVPDDPNVSIRLCPARRVAVREYSGTWSQTRYQEEKDQLLLGLSKAGLKAVGEAEFARYNSPYSLWFLRRNEVWIPVAP
jgi:hypothetical protein